MKERTKEGTGRKGGKTVTKGRSESKWKEVKKRKDDTWWGVDRRQVVRRKGRGKGERLESRMRRTKERLWHVRVPSNRARTLG